MNLGGKLDFLTRQDWNNPDELASWTFLSLNHACLGEMAEELVDRFSMR